MTGDNRASCPGASTDQVADALVAVAGTARWPDGTLLLDLHETVLRDLLAPHLTRALTQADARHPSETAELSQPAGTNSAPEP